jgi:hypothetical protein
MGSIGPNPRRGPSTSAKQRPTCRVPRPVQPAWWRTDAWPGR